MDLSGGHHLATYLACHFMVLNVYVILEFIINKSETPVKLFYCELLVLANGEQYITTVLFQESPTVIS